MATATKSKPTSAKPASAGKPAAKLTDGKISQRQYPTLEALADGKQKSHAEIAKATGRAKGNQLRPLSAAGYVKTVEGAYGSGNGFTLTEKGKAALASALKPKAKAAKG